MASQVLWLVVYRSNRPQSGFPAVSAVNYQGKPNLIANFISSDLLVCLGQLRIQVTTQ